MAACEPIGFSPEGEYLAQSTADGRLKIWETATNTLKQEYTPTSHLSATCTCLSWGPWRQKSPNTRKKKKQKYDVSDTTCDLQFIAMGTLSGNILLYSVVKGNLQSQMSNGHTDRVNSICWNVHTDSLYSCSDDHHIVEWAVQSGKVIRKWKTDQGSLYSLCLSPDGTSLISAGRSIQWWDLAKHKVVKKFTGHATEVRQLLFVSYSTDRDDGNYVISSAVGDRCLNAWHLNRKETDHQAVVSFTLPEEPLVIDVTRATSREQSLLLTAIVKSGLLFVFEHQLNGRRKKPLKPSVCVTIASSSLGNEDTPKPIPLVCAQQCGDFQRHILLAYGNALKLNFERMPYTSDEKEIFLVRNDPSKFTVDVQKSVTKIKQPDMNAVKVLAPGHMLPSAPTGNPEMAAKKRKMETVEVDKLPMEQRLSYMTLDDQHESGSNVPRVLNYSQLLLQGIQSSDSEMLNQVLSKSDDEVIVSTVARLPVTAVIPLLLELRSRVVDNQQLKHSYLSWIRCILSVHTSYLLSCRDLEGLLGPLYQILDARTHQFEKMLRLKGRLNLLLTQVKSQPGRPSAAPATSAPPVAISVYDDDESDEEVEDKGAQSDGSEGKSDDEFDIDDDGYDEDEGMESENELSDTEITLPINEQDIEDPYEEND